MSLQFLGLVCVSWYPTNANVLMCSSVRVVSNQRVRSPQEAKRKWFIPFVGAVLFWYVLIGCQLTGKNDLTSVAWAGALKLWVLWSFTSPPVPLCPTHCFFGFFGSKAFAPRSWWGITVSLSNPGQSTMLWERRAWSCCRASKARDKVGAIMCQVMSGLIWETLGDYGHLWTIEIYWLLSSHKHCGCLLQYQFILLFNSNIFWQIVVHGCIKQTFHFNDRRGQSCRIGRESNKGKKQ